MWIGLSVARANGYGVARMDIGRSPKASRSCRLLQIQQSGGPDSAGTLMRYKPESRAALHIALGGLPEEMRVEVDSDIQVSANTVGELREMTVWPENLVITTPQERNAESTIKVSKERSNTRLAKTVGRRSRTCGQGERIDDQASSVVWLVWRASTAALGRGKA